MTASYYSPSRLLPALNGLSVDMRLPLQGNATRLFKA